ncbi:peptidyl-prolyl cis-trans isomerase SurA [Edaphobacter aggregans]|uniref:Peptidyl-prolyl cis-trans isomerase SurA n=1 Tax=Edaphobacter aggregans TaxID=570835 RepID=A0A428MGY7_9BACT|nr:peptidylprolyl isomerase [Edaphobacter aggregans]RSL15999.1 peptidyl-prolyl cis-trans isomerase SurA [Edaphobacter aggregans]
MTFRISQFAALCGLSLLALPGSVQAQAPRYQSPLSVPATPQPQVLPTPEAITPNGAVVEDVIVRVNDQIISRSDLERSQQQLASELQQTGASPAEAEDRQKNMLRDMIDQQLLLSRGKELGLNADAEVIRRLDEIRKQNHLDSMEDLEKAARQQGVSFEDFKANIKNGVITQQVVRDEVGRHLQLTQAQEQAFYEAHKQEFAQPEQVRLSEILVPLPADANEAAIAQAQAKADDIAAKVKAGGKFDDLAKAYSGGPTAEQGGDLGQFKRGALAKVLEDQTFGLKAGEATSPIRTRQGFVILKVTDHQAAGVPALKDVEPQIQDAMYSQAMQPALRTYLTKLREDAYIDIKPGFVDTGASAKQTKPVFTAYAAPVPKKKKKEEQQKQRFERTRSTAKASAKPPVATPVSAVTSTASAATPTATTAVATTGKAVPAKPKKIKKEKVRYGQAPRNALPAGSQETATTGTDVGQGAASAAITPGGVMAQGNEAPGKAMAQPEGTSQVASSADDPLAPKVVAGKKTRYTDRIATEAATKEATKAAKAKEKIAAAPPPITADEKATTQTQAAPLGLNGDTAKKTKPAKVKGAPKERLQNKDTSPPPPPPAPEPTVNPALGATPPGTTPVAPTPAPATPPPATPPAAPQN